MRLLHVQAVEWPEWQWAISCICIVHELLKRRSRNCCSLYCSLALLNPIAIQHNVSSVKRVRLFDYSKFVIFIIHNIDHYYENGHDLKPGTASDLLILALNDVITKTRILLYCLFYVVAGNLCE
ncbi:hypothetical protein GDO81_012058 [Engystomops pustulosus]|uniref:Uncharacterized protein n=1 Tax=Engystomops pustulosus TaxID=76066 RepID=A0AAV7BIM7_ENGPU|nr:hypothetical protein GDO81_012058 [Engystomops pustulosus]